MTLEDTCQGRYAFGRETVPPGLFCPRTYWILSPDREGVLSVSGVSYDLSSGDLVLLTPFDICYVPEEEGISALVWRFSTEDLFGNADAFSDTLREGGVYPLSGQSRDVTPLISRAASQAERQNEQALLLSRMMLSELLLHLPDCAPVPKGMGKVVRAAEYLTEHFSEQVSLDTLCEEVGVSKFYLCRAFRRESGLTPHAYLNLYRVLRAESLMKAGEGAMASGTRVGFRDYTTFFRSYKKVTGRAPSDGSSPEEA